MQPKYYSIPQPCSENWNKMTPTKKGAFCAKCTKEVVDCSSLKTSEIKPEIESKADPCVRIFQRQIDEMNFLEWFNHLSLRKQLKYAFLFSFILVFSQKSVAQDQATSVQPQVVEIDSVDEVTKEELAETFEFAYDTNFTEVSCTVPDSINFFHPLLPGNEIILAGAIGPNPLIFGDWADIITPPMEISEELFSKIFEDPTSREKEKRITANFTNEVSIDQNNFTFLIEEDTLVFHANARTKTTVRIKIFKKDTDELIHFTPIAIPAGQTEINYPLDSFDNGAYIIILEGSAEKKAIELLYW